METAIFFAKYSVLIDSRYFELRYVLSSDARARHRLRILGASISRRIEACGEISGSLIAEATVQ